LKIDVVKPDFGQLSAKPVKVWPTVDRLALRPLDLLRGKPATGEKLRDRLMVGSLVRVEVRHGLSFQRAFAGAFSGCRWAGRSTPNMPK
jgi:hypothetical protein